MDSSPKLPMNPCQVARLALRGGLSPLAARAELLPAASWSPFVYKIWKTLLPMNRSLFASHVSRISLLVLGLLLGRAHAIDPWEQWSLSLKPDYLHGSDEDVSAFAAKAHAGFRNNKSLNQESTRTMVDYGFDMEAIFATDSRANSEGSYAEVFGGVRYILSKIGETGQADPVAPDPRNALNMDTAKEAKDYPFLHLSAKARFETDQTFENYQFAYGPVLGVVPTQRDQLGWWVAAPKTQIEFAGIEVLKSEDFRDRGIEEDSYWRLGVTADWRFEVGRWWASTNSFWYGMGIHTRVNYYRGIDMPTGAEEADLDQSLLYAGGLHYRIAQDKVKLGPLSLNLAYITLSYGRRPPEERDQFGIRMGLAFSWNEFGF